MKTKMASAVSTAGFLVDDRPKEKADNLQLQTLLGDIRIDLTPELIRKVNLIDNEDYSTVIRKAREDHAYSLEQLEMGVYGLKLYYILPLLDPKNAHAVSKFVDPFWHAHVLHSHQYAGFCHRIYGHHLCHIPLNRQDKEQMANIAVVYDYTIEILTKILGRRPDRKLYPEGSMDAYICWGSGTWDKEVCQSALFPEDERGVCIIAQRLNDQYAYAF